MGAQEEELQRVVCGLGRSGRRLDLDPLLAVATRGLGAVGVEELAPGNRDQPALRVGGLPVRPGQRSLDERFLHGVLGRREVSSAMHEDADHRGSQLPQQQFVHYLIRPGRSGHSVTVGGALRNGRTSSHSWIGLPPASGGCRQLAGERERALVAVDVDHHPAGDQVFGLREGPVGDWWPALPVVPDERALGRERLAVDVLTKHLARMPRRSRRGGMVYGVSSIVLRSLRESCRGEDGV